MYLLFIVYICFSDFFVFEKDFILFFKNFNDMVWKNISKVGFYKLFKCFFKKVIIIGNCEDYFF